MRRCPGLVTLFIIGSISILYGFETANNSTADLRTSFNKGWLFSRYGSMPDGSMKEEPAGLEKWNCADSLWRTLDLPHDWGIEGPFRMDLPSNTGKLPWAGIGWYRKHFKLSQEDKGKHLFIEFDGAMSHTRVWLNGTYIGEWPYGYASFRLELTPYIHFDKENVLAVRLDNPANSSRWYPGGGIYRNVWLVRSEPVHIAHWGTFVTTPRITSDQATVHIQNEIENQSGNSTKITVSVKITAYGKNEIIGSSQETTVQISAGGSEKSETEIVIQNPKLWNLESPNLYQVKTYIVQNKRFVDSAITMFGIRTVKFTPDNGFVLNGEKSPNQRSVQSS